MMENYFFDATSNRGPLMSLLGEEITRGRAAAIELWCAPGDAGILHQITERLRTIMVEARGQGRYQLVAIARSLLTAVKASPSPQQVDVLMSGFDELYELWAEGAQLEVTPLP